MNKEKKKLKIKTKTGRIITLTVDREVEGHYIGHDKFGADVIIAVTDISSAHEMKGSENDS